MECYCLSTDPIAFVNAEIRNPRRLILVSRSRRFKKDVCYDDAEGIRDNVPVQG